HVAIPQLVSAHGCDSAVFNHDGFADRKCIVDRNDLPVVKDQVGGLSLCAQTRYAPRQCSAQSANEFTSGKFHPSLTISSQATPCRRFASALPLLKRGRVHVATNLCYLSPCRTNSSSTARSASSMA